MADTDETDGTLLHLVRSPRLIEDGHASAEAEFMGVQYSMELLQLDDDGRVMREDLEPRLETWEELRRIGACVMRTMTKPGGLDGRWMVCLQPLPPWVPERHTLLYRSRTVLLDVEKSARGFENAYRVQGGRVQVRVCVLDGWSHGRTGRAAHVLQGYLRELLTRDIADRALAWPEFLNEGTMRLGVHRPTETTIGEACIDIKSKR